MKRILSTALAGLLAFSPAAFAQSIANVTLPYVSMVNPTDAFPDIPQGVPGVPSYFASALQLAGFNSSLPARSNVLIGGDATTNLFQRPATPSTAGASVTTTITYGGPDRWAYWSGTGTAMTVSQDATAADLPSQGYLYAFKMARTSGQTGVVQMCMVQEVESLNSYQFQGQTAELDFHATAGANFSAASSNMTAYIITGTGTDEGVSKLAFALNAGGGGSGTWTGQANATAAVIPISTASGRYAAIATIPTTATEIAVVLCYKPVGTAGTNDYIAFSGIQLVRNSSLAGSVSTTAGYNCTTINCTSFDRSRNSATEAQLQYRYMFKLTEGAAIQTRALCHDIDVTHADCLINFPMPMRIAPVFTGDGGFTAGFAVPTTTAGTTLGNCSALALSTNVTSTVASVNNALITCTATTVPAAGTVDILYDNNGSGVIKASSEL